MKKGPLLYLLMLLFLLPLEAEPEKGLDFLAREAQYLQEIPLSMAYSDGRILLLYPQGYLDLRDDLSLDGRTILSMWNSTRGQFPSIVSGWYRDDQWLLQGNDGILYSCSLPLGEVAPLAELPRDYQRLQVQDATALILYSQQGWEKRAFQEKEWFTQNRWTLSPLALILFQQEQLIFYDPLTRKLSFTEEDNLPLKPQPNSMMLHGYILENSLYLWDQNQCLVYSMTDGSLQDQLELPDGPFSSFQPSSEGLFQLNYSTGELSLISPSESQPFLLNDHDWREWILDLLNQDPPEGLQIEFYSWIYQKVLDYYLEYPLDSEMRQARDRLEIKLKENRSSLF